MPAYHVHRSTTINASPQKVFDTVADFGTWTTWSPWLIAEPEAEVRISDDPSSVGSSYSWSGDVVGAGELEHKKLEPGRLIEDEIRFLRPFKSVSQVSFEFEPDGDGTKVSWHMRGNMPWFMSWMVPMMKTFIGMDYARGLAMLKEWLETGGIQSETAIRGIESVAAFRVVGVRSVCSVTEVSQSMESVFAQAREKLQAGGLTVDNGASVYHHFDMKAGTFDYTAGFIVPATATAPAGTSDWSTEAIQAFRVEHVGPYHHLGNGWSAGHQHARNGKHGMKQAKMAAFEIYRNNPGDTACHELRTDIYLPLRPKILGLF